MRLLRFVLAVIIIQLGAIHLYAQPEFALAVNKKETTSAFQRLFADSAFTALKSSLERVWQPQYTYYSLYTGTTAQIGLKVNLY